MVSYGKTEEIMAENNNRKVVRYKRRPRVMPIICIGVLLYVISFVTLYLTKNKVHSYEVETGSLTSNASFSALILRDEKVYNSTYSGNINYYQREGTRIKKDDILYTVDETGKVADVLAEYSKADENSLSAENLAIIKSTLNNFHTGYDGSNFDEIYDMKTDINATILQAMNENIMKHMDSIVEKTGSSNLFQTEKAKEGGVIVYSFDNYENITPERLTASLFDKKSYNKTSMKAEDLVVTGNPAFKLIQSEQWKLCIPLTDKQIQEYDLFNKNSLSITIKKDKISTQGKFSIVNNDGNYYGVIELDKYMIRYATERFLDIEVATTGKSGLKVPMSALTDLEVYTIPAAYLTQGGNDSNYGFITESYSSNGEVTSKFVEVKSVKRTDDIIYLEKKYFEPGTNIVMPDATQRYIVGPTEKVKGVFCINSGYTVFETAEIIDQNNEYCILDKAKSGVSVYDRIILDADKYDVDKMIY